MLSIPSYYDDYLADFKRYFPATAEKAVSWYPNGASVIIVTLSDGSKVYYNGETKTIRTVCMDDDSMEHARWLFSRRVHQFLNIRGGSIAWLCEQTGISPNMMSRYMNGKSDPTMPKIIAIARALRCTVGDLLDRD